tara:strand:+ start:271 stop:624 length:354 start_codon:yes stop_codon:yes gene_type:complete
MVSSTTITTPYQCMAATRPEVTDDRLATIRECEMTFTATEPSDDAIARMRQLLGVPPSTPENPNRITSTFNEYTPGYGWKVNFPNAVVSGEPYAHVMWVHFSYDETTRTFQAMIPFG